MKIVLYDYFIRAFRSRFSVNCLMFLYRVRFVLERKRTKTYSKLVVDLQRDAF